MKISPFIIVQNSFCWIFILTLNICYSVEVTPTNRILVLGDSISAGFGLTQGKGWVFLLQDTLKTSNYSFEVNNASISGETTAGGRQRVKKLVDLYKPNILILELGANDALRGLSIKSSSQNLEEIILHAKKSRIKVLLVGMRVPSNYGEEYTKEFNQLFLGIAKKEFTSFVPFLLEGFATKGEFFQEDGIHPNEQAQIIMLKNVMPQLKILLQ